LVDELRHLDGIQGNFYLSENGYASPASNREDTKPANVIVYSNNKEIIQQQQHIFESIWNASTSAERKIKEIQGDANLGITEIIDNPSKTQTLFIDLIKTAKFEILLILPTVNAFLREYRMGILQWLKELSLDMNKGLIEIDDKEDKNEVKQNKANRKNISVKILTPANYLVNKLIDKLTTITYAEDYKITPVACSKSSGSDPIGENSSINEKNDIQPLQIRYLESPSRYNVTTATILIVDRKASLVIEKVDDFKTEFIETIGLSTYSTSKPTISSYVSIFENFWNQIELYEKLRATEETEKEFINLAAHELRTPAHAILGYAELAMMEDDIENKDSVDNDSKKRGDHIAAIYRNALRLQRLTKDILDVARIESNILKLNKDRFDLVEKINDVINDTTHAQIVKTTAETKNNTEIIFNKPVYSLLVDADRVRINEVISNLLYNAINATKNNGKITISTRLVESAVNNNNNSAYINNNGNNNNDAKKTSVIVCIKDSGKGIDPEIEPRLFTKFATKSESGLGLGLYISRSIIEAHGGKIWGVNNKDEEGATFGFSLSI
jgi:two-component system sensor histidine kinase VicK